MLFVLYALWIVIISTLKSTWYLYILYVDLLLHSMLISSLQLCKNIKQLLKCQYVLDTHWLWESGPKCVLHVPKFMACEEWKWDICCGRGRRWSCFQFSLLTCCVLFRVVVIMVNARQEIISANISGDLVGWL